MNLGAAALLCFLGGTQGERLAVTHMKKRLAREKNEGESKQAWLPFGLQGVFGGSPVCRKEDLSDGPSAVRRYRYKISKLNEAAKKVMLEFSPRDAEEVKNRVQQFASCVELTEDTSMPRELKDLIVSSNESMQSISTNLSLSFVAAFKKQGAFPEVGVCGFFPDHVDVAGAAAHGGNALRVMHHQLYGSGCASAAAANYMGGRTDAEQKLAHAQVQVFEELLNASLGTATLEGAAKVDKIISQSVMELEEAEAKDFGQPLPGSSLVEGPGEGIAAFFYICFIVIVAAILIALKIALIVFIVWAIVMAVR